MFRYASLILTGFLALNAQAEVYRWVDPDGQVHYGDRRPPGGAEPVTLPGQASGTRLQQDLAPRIPTESGTQSTQGAYTRLSILQPRPDSTLQGPSGIVAVSIALEPALQEGHYVELTLDGVVVAGRKTTLNLQLRNVLRGPHELQAAVYDANSEVMARSNPVRFFLRQSSPSEREGAERDYQEWLSDVQQKREEAYDRERREQQERFTRDLREQKERVEERRRGDFETKQQDSPRFDAAYPKLPQAESRTDEKYSTDKTDLVAPEREQSEQRRGEIDAYDPAAIPRTKTGESEDFDPGQARQSDPSKAYAPSYAPSYAPPGASNGK